MDYNLSSQTKNICDSCGISIQSGDLVYDNGSIYVHDECFFDYIRMFVLQNGWRHTVYGDEEME